MECDKCKPLKATDESKYYAEITTAFAERSNKRLFVALLITIILLVATNICWIVHEAQYEDVKVTQENSSGYNNFIGNDGDITNGKANY